MLIKPVLEQLNKEPKFFWETRASRNIPALDDLKNSKVVLPICYFLPVKEKGGGISSDHRPQQSIASTYSFCIIAPAADFNTLDEPPMTQAKQKLFEALIGFSISPFYSPLAFVAGQAHEGNTKYESWIFEFEAVRTFRKVT